MKLSALHKAKSSRSIKVDAGSGLMLRLRRLRSPEVVALSHRVTRAMYEIRKIEAEVDAVRIGTRLLAADTDDVDQAIFDSIYLEVTDGLVGVEGVVDDDGAEVTLGELKTAGLVTALVEQLDLAAIMGVVAAWIEGHDISERAKKNSSSGPPAATASPARGETPEATTDATSASDSSSSTTESSST